MKSNFNLDLSKVELSYLNCAREISKQSDHRHKIGCVLVKGHKIISSGHNSDSKTHAIQTKLDCEYFKANHPGKLHAETETLLYFIKHHIDLTGSILYTYRETNSGKYGCARPCPRCMQLIKAVGIKRLVYTTDQGVAKERLEY